MKRVCMILLSLIISSTIKIYSQDIFFPEIEPLLSLEQKSELEKAVNILLKARGNENNANDIERKYSKFKKGNYEKWVFKTWEAKLQRIMAEKHYKSAYLTISAVYSDLIANGKYENNNDKMEALSLDKKAKENFSDANGIFEQYAESTKESMEQTPNEQVDSTLHESHLLKLSGIGFQIEALQKLQGILKETGSKTEDDLAWEKAKKTNTISSYYEYLNNSPRGHHMTEANEIITKLEKESASKDIADNNTTKSNKNPKNNRNTNNENTENSNNNKNNTSKGIKGDLIFKVQIAAAKTELSQWMLSAIAPGVKNIEKRESEGWLKYSIGEFGSYREAAKYRDEIRSHVPDAFIVVFKAGMQVEVTNEMKM